MGDFNGTEIQIWAGFGLVGNTKKRIVSICSGCFFFMFLWEKFILFFFFKTYSVKFFLKKIMMNFK